MVIGAFPPVLVTMAKDPRLRPTDIQAYILASQHLDWVDFRPLKLRALAYEMHTGPSNATKSMRRLVAFGYLMRGERVTELDGSVREYVYRIPHSVAAQGRVDRMNTPQPRTLSPSGP